jgi:hypothetical protein
MVQPTVGTIYTMKEMQAIPQNLFDEGMLYGTN